METIKKCPIADKKEFRKNGALYRQVRFNPENGLYLYEVREIGYDYQDKVREVISWEVVKGVSATQPDGSKVLIYPNTEQFGLYGWAFNSREWAEKCWAEGHEAFCRWRDEWRKSKTV